MVSVLQNGIFPLSSKLSSSSSFSPPSPHVASLAGSRKEGDISSVFVSLSGADTFALPDRFADIKSELIQGKEDHLITSWQRLLKKLAVENEWVAQNGSSVIPQIDYQDLRQGLSKSFEEEVKKRGVAIVRGVVPQDEARQYKTQVEDYVAMNPSTKAFPKHDPQVFELYWSPPQMQARSHPNLVETQRFLMSLWHSMDENAPIDTYNPLTYADRVRIRKPGDAGFALGPHVDGGSVERWEPRGYGHGGVYDKIWSGAWEEYDAFESSCRISVESDLYQGAGACTMFRMFQGWLSMSNTGPKQGTLMVNPMIQLTTAYILLRPFFTPITAMVSDADGKYPAEFLAPENWILQKEMTSELQGARPGYAQELNAVLHPHLDLARTMVHIPQIKPGDFVVWHCDTIHAVDKVHLGKSDSSVIYIPVCPVTEANAAYLSRQRETFQSGVPGPDFPGGKGESEHVGRPTEQYLREHMSKVGLQGMGLEPLDVPGMEAMAGARDAVKKANEILGFQTA